jgi:pimeloyl-ACP methyl ester carboxylesterase
LATVSVARSHSSYAERYPAKVHAIVALAPAAVESPNTAVPPAATDRPISTSREAAQARFANSRLFPAAAFDHYCKSLMPFSPNVRNAAIGLSDGLMLDRSKLAVWKQIPVLHLVADEDKTVSPGLSLETASTMGVPVTSLAKDWGLAGHGHLFIVESGHDVIAGKVNEWLAGHV